MNSRMEKYENDDFSQRSRISRNRKLYNEINKTELTNFNSFNNAKVIKEGAKEIDLMKIKKYVEKINGDSTDTRKSLLDAQELHRERKLQEEEEKDYDLISVLEKAREKREVDYQKERYKKLRDTQYDILSNLNLYNKKEEEKEEENFNTQEKTLIDLINTVAMNKNKNDLLNELQSDDETMIGSIEEESSNTDLKALINEEINKDKTNTLEKDATIQSIDKSFYTNSLNFSKEDFEDFGDIKEENTILAKIGIVFLIICILGVMFLIANFIFDLNIIEL